MQDFDDKPPGRGRDLARESGPSLVQVSMTSGWPSEESVRAWDSWFDPLFSGQGSDRDVLRDHRKPKRPHSWEPTMSRPETPAGNWMTKIIPAMERNLFISADGTHALTIDRDDPGEDWADGYEEEVDPEESSSAWVEDAQGADGERSEASGKATFAQLSRSLLPFEPTNDVAAAQNRIIKNDLSSVVVRVSQEVAVCSTYSTGQTILLHNHQPYQPSVGVPFRFMPSEMDVIFRVGDELRIPQVELLNRHVASASVMEGISNCGSGIGYALVVGFTTATNRPILRTFQPDSSILRVLGPSNSVAGDSLYSTVAYRYTRPLGGDRAVETVVLLGPYCCEETITIPRPESQHPGPRLTGTSVRDRSLVEIPRVVLSKTPYPFGEMAEGDESGIASFHRRFQGYQLVCKTCPSVPLGVADDLIRPQKRVAKIVRYYEPAPLPMDSQILVECDQSVARAE